ncbi:MAG: ParB/RepB/Spo0J family partition protein [Bacillota bacterium]|nr:ParB/RepB/Spo0J family partition protein [Bacillota bacterium]
MVRQALGRGLGALIPQVEADQETEVRRLPVKDIIPGPVQPRHGFDQGRLAELAESIRQHGVVQPLLVRPRGDRYELVAGERRWRAAQLAELEEVPAIVRNLDDADALKVALVENLQREDLNPLEEAEAYSRLIQEFHMTQEEVSAAVGKSRPVVANTLRLLQLAPPIQRAIADGQLSAGHGRALLGVSDTRTQQMLFTQTVQRGLTVRELEKLVERWKAGSPRPGARRRGAAPNPEVAALEEELRRALGTRVHLRPGRKVGHLDIEFYGPDELERILERLGVRRSRVGGGV